jgi:hypothetical protein
MICERDVSVSCRRGADRIPLAAEIQFVALGAMELLDDIVTRRDLNLRILSACNGRRGVELERIGASVTP